MAQIIKMTNYEPVPSEKISENGLMEITNGLLFDARAEIPEQKTLSVPLAQLATLGAGVSSLLPALRTVSQTTTINTSGLYQLANAAVGDTLKVAKNGNFWGAFNTRNSAPFSRSSSSPRKPHRTPQGTMPALRPVCISTPLSPT